MHPIEALTRELRDEKKKEERLARIEELEDRICDHAAGVLEAALSFHEVRPNQEEPPQEWIDQYGEQGARQRLEVAKAGWLPQSLAPNATRLASYVYTGITRARGTRGAMHARVVNVKIALPPPTGASHPNPVIDAMPSKELDE